MTRQVVYVLLTILATQPAQSETTGDPPPVTLSAEEIRLKLEAAELLESSGQHQEALAHYEVVLAAGVTGVQLEQALYGKASTCLKAGCGDEAGESIHRLVSQFPDSRFATAAGVLKAQLDQVDPAPAQALAASESQAAEIVESARQQARSGDLDLAISALEYVITHHGGTASALRANDTKGHLLLRKTQRADAVNAFRGILDQVGSAAPTSRIVQMAKIRLAALYRTSKSTDDKRVALGLYQEVAADPESAYMSKAAMESIGLEIELLPWKARLAKTIPPEQWDQIRQRCQAVLELPRATPAEEIKADLFILESYAWQGDPHSAAAQGAQLLAKYEPGQFRKEIATARFFLGEELQKLGRLEEAIDQFRQVLAAYPTEIEIWPNMDHLPRTQFRIWECLRQRKASRAEIDAAAARLIERFPQSYYAGGIRFVQETEKQP